MNLDKEALFLMTSYVEEMLRLEAAYQHGRIGSAEFAAAIGELARKTLYWLTGE